MSFYYYNGQITDTPPLIPVTDRQARFGDGVFETIRIEQAQPSFWPYHIARLQAGLDVLAIAYPLETLGKEIHQFIAAIGQKEGMLRLTISRGQGSVGYLPAKNCKPAMWMEWQPLPDFPAKPARLMLSCYEKSNARSLPVEAKLSANPTSILARMEAEASGVDEAILCNRQGYVAECSASNLFWARDGIIYTASDSVGVLKGVIRAALLDQYDEIPIIPISAHLDALKEADEVWLTNAAQRTRVVEEIIELQASYTPGPIAAKIRQWLDAHAI